MGVGKECCAGLVGWSSCVGSCQWQELLLIMSFLIVCSELWLLQGFAGAACADEEQLLNSKATFHVGEHRNTLQ